VLVLVPNLVSVHSLLGTIGCRFERLRFELHCDGPRDSASASQCRARFFSSLLEGTQRLENH
jgi:hypothetical protein